MLPQSMYPPPQKKPTNNTFKTQLKQNLKKTKTKSPPTVEKLFLDLSV